MLFINKRPHITRVTFDETLSFVVDALDMMQFVFCSRCAGEKYHHAGRINTYLQTRTVSEQHINAWIKDTEHGLFHGLSTAIVASLFVRKDFASIKQKIKKGGHFLVLKAKNFENRRVSHKFEDHIDPHNYSDYESPYGKLSFERLIASALMHDLYRVKKDDAHDHHLKKWLPKLLPETYSHANPDNYNHPLILADVLELRRYSDLRQWYQAGKIEPYITQPQLDILECYYSCIRPALEEAFRYRDSPWICHGPEVPQDILVAKFPQHPINWLAVEIDRLPFQTCMLHDEHLDIPWGALRGIISLPKLKELGGKVAPHKESYRDHLFAKIDATFQDWIFVVNEETNQESQWAFQLINNLVFDNQKVITKKLLYRFSTLVQTIENRMRSISD